MRVGITRVGMSKTAVCSIGRQPYLVWIRIWFIEIPVFRNQGRETVFEIFFKRYILITCMTDLIITDISTQLFNRIVLVNETDIFLMNYDSRDSALSIRKFLAVTTIRACHIRIHIHAAAFNISYENRELAYLIVIIQISIAFVYRCKTALSDWNFAIFESHICIDIFVCQF